MNIMEKGDLGESSCRKTANNDKMSDRERPLKKAKFAWQVKGRYHLKEQESSNENHASEVETQISETNVPKDNKLMNADSEISSKTEQNLEILGDYLLKQDFNILDPLLSDSNSVSEKIEEYKAPEKDEDLSVSLTDELLTYPKYTASKGNVSMGCSSDSDAFSNETVTFNEHESDQAPCHPPSMIHQRNFKTEDQYLARWQARQIAKGFVDNTINRVLDSWLVAPLPHTSDDSHNLALDVAEFLDYLPESNNVENEGILMAISAHGLQNNQSTPRNIDSRSQNRNIGSRITIAISECVSRNEDSNGNDDQLQNHCCSLMNQCHNSDEQSSVQNENKSSSSSSVEDNQSNSEGSNNVPSAHNNRNENSSWRHVAQPCTCSHATRRTKVTPNIPFHRRDNLDYLTDSITTHEAFQLPETMPDLIPEIVKNETQNTEEIPTSNITDQMDGPNSESNHYQSTDENNQDFEHFDFMDAAVSFAIQNKGLTSFNSVDYG